MTYTKQTVFITTATTRQQINSDSDLVAIMTAKQEDMVSRNLYDRNIMLVPNGDNVAFIRKWPTLEAAQEWVDYGSQQTSAKGYTWQSFDIQSI